MTNKSSDDYKIRIKCVEKQTEIDKIYNIKDKLDQIQEVLDNYKKGQILDTSKIDHLVSEIKSYNLNIGLPSDASKVIKKYNGNAKDIYKHFNDEYMKLKEQDINRRACFQKFYDML